MTGEGKRRDTIDVSALMECCLAQQEIIKTYGIIVERLCESVFLDAETEEEMQRVEKLKKEKPWEL